MELVRRQAEDEAGQKIAPLVRIRQALAPGQVDQDRLPTYEVLDAVLVDYVERDLGRAQLLAAGHDQDVVDKVIRLVDLAEWKRRQYPPGPKISPKNFGRDRRLPITSRWRETPLS